MNPIETASSLGKTFNSRNMNRVWRSAPVVLIGMYVCTTNSFGSNAPSADQHDALVFAAWDTTRASPNGSAT